MDDYVEDLMDLHDQEIQLLCSLDYDEQIERCWDEVCESEIRDNILWRTIQN